MHRRERREFERTWYNVVDELNDFAQQLVPLPVRYVGAMVKGTVITEGRYEYVVGLFENDDMSRWGGCGYCNAK